VVKPECLLPVKSSSLLGGGVRGFLGDCKVEGGGLITEKHRRRRLKGRTIVPKGKIGRVRKRKVDRGDALSRLRRLHRTCGGVDGGAEAAWLFQGGGRSTAISKPIQTLVASDEQDGTYGSGNRGREGRI